MTRNMDVIRKIILAVADSQDTVKAVKGISDDDFKYHAMLLKDANLIKGVIAMALGPGNNIIPDHAMIRDLTWAGHDFADAIKNDDIWAKTKDKITKVGSWTFDILLECLKEEAKKRLGLAISS